MDSTFSGDFAKLMPCNHMARHLFSRTFIHVEKNDEFHLRFMSLTDRQPLAASDEPVESSTDYDTLSDSDANDGDSFQHLGYFILSFDEERGPQAPHLGWKVGRGTSRFTNRNVDFMLARPGDKMGKSLAAVHMVFRFNLQSGFLMVKGGSAKVSVEHNISGTWKELGLEEGQLLYQSTTLLRAGACEYELKFAIEEKHKVAYFNQRDRFLESISPGGVLLQRPPRKMPGDRYVGRERYLELESTGHGRFGWINQGVDTKTGNLVAIKELRISNRHGRLEAMAEVDIGRRFLHKRGLLPILDAFCIHGYPHGCCNLENFYIIMPYAQSDFSTFDWSNSDVSRQTKLKWLREPLEGLKTLHTMGIMHRDIRRQNTLILSEKPARASICDYGKAVEAETCTVTTIGPISTLAPEVWTVSTDGPYTHKIDVWAYGYAIAEVLGYCISKYPGADGDCGNNPRITRNRHQAMLGMLRAHSQKAAEDEPLVDLATKLLTWRPAERWSAALALEHRCWAPITQNREEDGRSDQGTAVQGGHPQAKRARQDDSKANPSDRPSVQPGDDLTTARAGHMVLADTRPQNDTQLLSEETFARYLERIRRVP